MNEMFNLIQTVGFPIGMCLLLFFYMQEESKSHKDEVDLLKDAINELKIAIIELKDRIKGERDNEK